MPRCENGCNYHIDKDNGLLICEDCQRVKGIADFGKWRILH